MFVSFASIKLGTPAKNQKIIVTFREEEIGLGEFYFDEKIKISNPEYANNLDMIGIKEFYSMESSSTAEIKEDYTSNFEYESGGGYFKGKTVIDIFEIGGKKMKKKFNVATEITQVYSQILNGIVNFSRNKDNYIDIMYQQNVISNRDYLLKGRVIVQEIDYGGFIDKRISQNIDLFFDLDKKSDYYKYPSNDLVKNSNAFDIKLYGIYLNGKDVTDKLKYKVVSFDNIVQQNNQNAYLEIPKDMYDLIKESDIGPYFDIYNFSCKNCQCEEVKKFPTIKLIAQEYVFDITPDMYLNAYSYDQYSNSCSIGLISSSFNKFSLSNQFIFKNKIPIMYQKETNSIKLIGVETINHMDIRSLIIPLSILNGIILIALVGLSTLFITNFRVVKLEYTSLINKTKIL